MPTIAGTHIRITAAGTARYIFSTPTTAGTHIRITATRTARYIFRTPTIAGTHIRITAAGFARHSLFRSPRQTLTAYRRQPERAYFGIQFRIGPPLTCADGSIAVSGFTRYLHMFPRADMDNHRSKRTDIILSGHYTPAPRKHFQNELHGTAFHLQGKCILRTRCKGKRLRHIRNELRSRHPIEHRIHPELKLTRRPWQYHRSGRSFQVCIRRGKLTARYGNGITLRYARNGQLGTQYRFDRCMRHIAQSGRLDTRRGDIARFRLQSKYQFCTMPAQVVEHNRRTCLAHRLSCRQRSGIVHTMPHRNGASRAASVVIGIGYRQCRSQSIEVVSPRTQQ